MHLGRILIKSKIKALNVSKNLMGDEGIVVMVDAIERAENKVLLNRLDISSSKVSDKVTNIVI